jgi:hopanoid C-3 methylase
MKILFVQPPQHDPAFALSYATEPLGLETIAASVPGHDVALVDLRFSRASFKATFEQERPLLVATGGDTANTYDLQAIAREAKRLDPRVRTVIGGHHATIQPQDFATPDVDAVVLGPGEETFPELVDAWDAGRDAAGIPGLALVRDGRLVRTAPRPLPKDLNASPFPRRDLAAPYRSRYRAFGRPIGLLNTSRGCPLRCKFCSIINEMGGRYLTKSPERVVEELSHVPQRDVRFADGNTLGSSARAKRLAAALVEARLGKRFMIDARADTIVRNPELFERWHEAGLKIVAVGLEAVNDRALEALGKDSTVKEHVEAVRVLRGAGLEVIGQFMIDPDFEARDFDDLAAFVLRHGIHYPSFTILTPFPQTVFAEQRAEQVVTRDWRRYDCMHSVMVPRLGWDEFYRRYIALYETCYGPGRVLEAVRQRLDPRTRRAAASPLILGAVALQIRVSRPKLERAYGVREDKT